MRTANINLIEMANATVASGDRDIFELNIHVILGFEEFAAVNLTRCDLERDDMALRLVQQLDWDTDRARHNGWFVIAKFARSRL